MAPIVEATADKYRNQIHTIKVDVNADPKLADDFQIRGIPTLVLMQDGAVIDRQVGATSQAELSQWLAQHLSNQQLPDQHLPAQQ
ncbi:hypothetical protein GCM10022277_29250 [Litoribacillus peritrichatus]|uniref:Thioredoxin domain-containing protein n=2 Tax=Litoribacillus peritrichatus TaxID=718191 RepID=A0ABP7MV32_9GAMM